MDTEAPSCYIDADTRIARIGSEEHELSLRLAGCRYGKRKSLRRRIYLQRNRSSAFSD
jgi:hypothetical protein